MLVSNIQLSSKLPIDRKTFSTSQQMWYPDKWRHSQLWCYVDQYERDVFVANYLYFTHLINYMVVNFIEITFYDICYCICSCIVSFVKIDYSKNYIIFGKCNNSL